MDVNLAILLAEDWRTFEKYPEEGALVMVHIQGYAPKEKKNYHLFKKMKFHAQKFDPYSIRDNSKPFVIWTYSWLYAHEVYEQ